MYIDRNEQGQIVGVYAAKQHDGQEYLEGAVMYAPPPSKSAEIRALEAPLADEQMRMTRQINLQMALDWACKQAPTLTPAQVHDALMAQGTGYFKLYNLEQAAKAIRDRV